MNRRSATIAVLFSPPSKTPEHGGAPSAGGVSQAPHAPEKEGREGERDRETEKRNSKIQNGSGNGRITGMRRSGVSVASVRKF